MDRHRLTDVGPTAIFCGYADSGMPLSVHCRSIFRMYYITLGCVSKNLQDLGLYMLAVNLYARGYRDFCMKFYQTMVYKVVLD